MLRNVGRLLPNSQTVFPITVFYFNESTTNEQSRIACRGGNQNSLGVRHVLRAGHDDMLGGVI